MNIPPLSIADIEHLENKLDINFSKAFLKISCLADFEYFTLFPFYNLNLEANYSVIGETLRLRSAGKIPKNSIVLYEDDVSIIFMQCLNSHEEVFIIALEDVEKYCKGKELKYDYEYFPTFTDFFEYLLEEEEKIRAEDGK